LCQIFDKLGGIFGGNKAQYAGNSHFRLHFSQICNAISEVPKKLFFAKEAFSFEPEQKGENGGGFPNFFEKKKL